MITNNLTDVDRLCSFLFLRTEQCSSVPILLSTISNITGAPIEDVTASAARLEDKTLEDRNVELFTKFKQNALNEDALDFKVLLCIAFSNHMMLKELIGSYQLDLLKIVADMDSDRIANAVSDAEQQGLVVVPRSNIKA